MRRWLILMILASFGLTAGAEPPMFKELRVGTHRIRAELANTERSRETGLMFRKRLAESNGMLFVFERSGRYCFWMKNTQIPLSIAFLDQGGKIVTLADMAPGSEEAHCPDLPVRYALEMNQGWFLRRGIGVGAVVIGTPRQ